MDMAFWVVFTVVAALSAVLMRICVRLFARGADNGWDNALGYVIAISALFYFPVRWIIGAHSIPLLLLVPPIVLLVQLFSLKAIYQVTWKRAAALGALHTVVSSLFFGTITFVIAVVAAYIMYGRIIADPMILVRIIMKLLDIPFPFES